MKLVRESAPDAACLVWSPIDATVRTMGGDLVPRRGSRMVADIFRDVAKEGGCAYWDALSAMGDEGSAIRWLSAGLLNEDLIHPRARARTCWATSSTWPSSAPTPRAVAEVAAEPAGLGTTRPSPPPSRACARWRRARLPAGHPSAGRLAHRLALFHGRDAHRAGGALRRRRARLHRRGQGLGPAEARGRRARADGRVDGGDALRAAVPGQAWSLGGVRAVGAPGPRCASASARAAPPPHAARAPLALLAGWPRRRAAGGEGGRQAPCRPSRRRPSRSPPTVRIRSFPSPAPPTRCRCSTRAAAPSPCWARRWTWSGPASSTTRWACRAPPPPRWAAWSRRRSPRSCPRASPSCSSSGTAPTRAASDLDAEKLRAEYGTLIARLRKDAGGAECLVLGTTDRLRQREDGSGAPGLARCGRAGGARAGLRVLVRADRHGWGARHAALAARRAGPRRRHPPDARGLREARGPLPRRPARGLRGFKPSRATSPRRAADMYFRTASSSSSSSPPPSPSTGRCTATSGRGWAC